MEFQPSSWASGSHLNVGAMWLWQEKGYLSFDVGYRVEEFSEFCSEAQFGVVARSLSERAAHEVARYRRLFPSIYGVCSYYSRHSPVELWPTFDAAIAFAIAGDIGAAKRLFGKAIRGEQDDRDWVKAARAKASNLCAIVDDAPRFRITVEATVHRTRELLKLPALSSLSFE